MEAAEDRTLEVGELIRRLFPLAKKHDVRPQDSLFAGGILDSLGVLELVNALEDRFGITIDEDDLVPENFQSIDRIAAFVGSKR